MAKEPFGLYTKGPWKLQFPSILAGEREIARLSDAFGSPDGTEMLANGQLVETAPELLEALLKLVLICSGPLDGLAPALEEGWRVIDKALGVKITDTSR